MLAPTSWGNGITVVAGETTGTPTVDPKLKWCSNTSSALGATATAIGAGMANTTTARATCTTGAIYHADLYAGNGKTDWHLPSKDELNELCKYARTREGQTSCESAGTSRTGFSIDYYSSSEDGTTSTRALDRVFSDGSEASDLKLFARFVRPVQASG